MNIVKYISEKISLYKDRIVASNIKNFENAILLDKFKVHMSQSTSRRYTATLLVSCVDFRFRDEVERLMSDFLHLMGDYDEIALPGGSLSLVEKKHQNWGQCLEEIIILLKDMHHIKRVIFLDHRGCGAYKLILGPEAVSTREKETETHKNIFKETRKFMRVHFPELKVYTLLMGLDGVVENIK